MPPTGCRWRRRAGCSGWPASPTADGWTGRSPTPNWPRHTGPTPYLPIGGGKFCYLATVIDLASRRLTGSAIADHIRADLVTDALAAAVHTRGSLAGTICTRTTELSTRAKHSPKRAGQQGPNGA
ncbi:DDE-type integrase/transposase/recombinase [Streptomyces sp. NPDC006617]|uniref:DDE-type integrase/transposase/recombinase n=1 Tax=Streptomyces sp. NPDC006617 TaxID=3155354 RepID=UPI0033A951B2